MTTYTMKFKGIGRKELAQALAQVLESEVSYKGAPSFNYTVADANGNVWTITKGDELMFSTETLCEADALGKLKTALAGTGFTTEGCNSKLTIPADGHTGSTFRNLVNMAASKEGLILKALGADNSNRFDKQFIDSLNHFRPETIENFKELLPSPAGEAPKPLIEFGDGTITFNWFPATLDGEEIAAYILFAHALSQQAKVQKSVSAKETATDNEKFTFRVFLLKLGFIGDDYKFARRVLLERLSGNGSFATESSLQKALEKRKQPAAI